MNILTRRLFFEGWSSIPISMNVAQITRFQNRDYIDPADVNVRVSGRVGRIWGPGGSNDIAGSFRLHINRLSEKGCWARMSD